MIRLAGVSDLPTVAILEQELFGSQAWSQEELRAELDGPGRRFVVAEDGSELAGYAVSMALGDILDLQRIRSRFDPERCQDLEHRSFELTHILMQIASTRIQIKDWINDDLRGSMISRTTAATDFEHLTRPAKDVAGFCPST